VNLVRWVQCGQASRTLLHLGLVWCDAALRQCEMVPKWTCALVGSVESSCCCCCCCCCCCRRRYCTLCLTASLYYSPDTLLLIHLTGRSGSARGAPVALRSPRTPGGLITHHLSQQRALAPRWAHCGSGTARLPKQAGIGKVHPSPRQPLPPPRANGRECAALGLLSAIPLVRALLP